MKSLLCFCCYALLSMSLFSSCSSLDSNVNLTVSEDEHEYRLLANYPENNTGKVEEYLDEKIGNQNDLSFTNAVIDADLTLDDGTKMYVVNKPGKLRIKLNKNENSAASYQKIKALGEGLQPFLNHH